MPVKPGEWERITEGTTLWSRGHGSFDIDCHFVGSTWGKWVVRVNVANCGDTVTEWPVETGPSGAALGRDDHEVAMVVADTKVLMFFANHVV